MNKDLVDRPSQSSESVLTQSRKGLTIGIHGDNSLKGGRYNVLSSFSAGLLQGFQNIGLNAQTTKECFEKNVLPSLTIGFNGTGYETWPEYLKRNIPTIMWSVDSVFYQNIEAIEQFNNNPSFILFNVSPSDTEALNAFYPALNHTYLPHAVDLNLWKKQDCKKEYDLVFLSSIYDYEAKIEELRQTLPSESFELIMTMYEVWLSAANLPFWEIYQIFKKQANLNFDLNQYNFVFKNLSYLVTYTKRAQMIESLKDYNVKVFGSGPWEKYTKGKVQYMGECDLLESINIVNKSKIVLHIHPSQLTLGLHERVLNASAVESFVLSSKSNSIESAFQNNMGYFDLQFADLKEQVEYYLNNDDERTSKAQNARKIVAQNHTWDARAQQIIGMIN